MAPPLLSSQIMGFLRDLRRWHTAEGTAAPLVDGGVCISYKGDACLIVTNAYVYINLGSACMGREGLYSHLPVSHRDGGSCEVYGMGLFGRGADTYYLNLRNDDDGGVSPPRSAEEEDDVSRLIDAFVALGREPELFDRVFDAMMKTMARKRWSERSMDSWHTDPTWPNEGLRVLERCAMMLNIVGEVPTVEHEPPGSSWTYSNGTVDTSQPIGTEDHELELYHAHLQPC